MKTIPQPGQLVRHIRTGGLYKVKEIGLAKINGKWVDVVIYINLLNPALPNENKPTFVREVDPFMAGFEEAVSAMPPPSFCDG